MVKRSSKYRKTKITKGVKAHAPVRKSCRWCEKPGGKNHTKDIDRFHRCGSFCKTHHSTKIGRKYCNSDGTKKKQYKGQCW